MALLGKPADFGELDSTELVEVNRGVAPCELRIR